MKEKLKRALDAGEWIGSDSELAPAFQSLLTECGFKRQRYNSTVMSADEMRSAMEDITGQKMSPDTVVVFPFTCDLGFNIHLGKDVIVNYNCTFLDTGSITIGDHTKIGPGCHFLTADHPRDAMERRKRLVRGRPIKVGDDCWFGGNVTVLPGVTIGDRCIIGAGSVVTKDVPSDSVYVGNPAHKV